MTAAGFIRIKVKERTKVRDEVGCLYPLALTRRPPLR